MIAYNRRYCYPNSGADHTSKYLATDNLEDLATSFTQFTGDSCIIDPRGEVIAGPVSGESILVAEGSMEAVLAAKAGCDVTGHYSPQDIFQLLVYGQLVLGDTGLNHLSELDGVNPVVAETLTSSTYNNNYGGKF